MQNFDAVDKIVEVYKNLMPKTVYLMKNKGRYDEILKAIAEITTCAVEIDDEAEVRVEPDPLTGSSLCLEIITDLLVIDVIDKFCAALKKASNFEVCPLTDGRISFGVLFEDAFVPAPPHGSKTEVRR